MRLDSLARRIIEALHKPVEIEGFGPSFFLTASIGVAFGRYATPDDLLRDAQLALFAAKAAGKDRYTLFNANMRSIIEGRGVLEVELNTALQDGQFLLLYQPVYELVLAARGRRSRRCSAGSTRRRASLPAEFIPLAEESGLIVPIGRWVLEQACVAGSRVERRRPPRRGPVKVSANQLNRDGFVTDVLRALQQSGLEPSLLDAGDRRDHGDGGHARRPPSGSQEIKQLGVRIAIDDFGSGYAYRADLQRMPIDFLKVDRSSLAAGEDEDYRSWLLEAILVVRARPLADRDRQGRSKARSRSTRSRRWAARWPRASSSASRSRPTPSAACSPCLHPPQPRGPGDHRHRRPLGRRDAASRPRRDSRPAAQPRSAQPREPDLVQHVVALASYAAGIEQLADAREHPFALGMRQLRDPAEAGHPCDDAFAIELAPRGDLRLAHRPERRVLFQRRRGAPRVEGGCSGRDSMMISPSSRLQGSSIAAIVRRIATPPPGRSTRLISGIARRSSNQWKASAAITASHALLRQRYLLGPPALTRSAPMASASSSRVASSGSTAVSSSPASISAPDSCPVPAPSSSTGEPVSSPAPRRAGPRPWRRSGAARGHNPPRR